MNVKTLVSITMAVVVTLTGALAAIAQTGENAQLKKYYKTYISKCISKNQSKAGLQASRSKNLRSCGALSRQKVIFLTNNQNMLVDEMIKNKIGTKPYKIDHYLNQRFHNTNKIKK